MITFPEGFVKLQYPGYFWDVYNKKLYSIKTDGRLKELKLYKGYHGISKSTGSLIDIPDGYMLSVNGGRRNISLDYLMQLGYSSEIDMLYIPTQSS